MQQHIMIPQQATPAVAGRGDEAVLRDLHDGVGPSLAALALGLRAARNIIRSDPDAAELLLKQLQQEVAGAMCELRRLTEPIRLPTAVDRMGIVAAVRRFAAALSNRLLVAGGHSLTIEVETIGDLDRLPALVQIAAYRIICEAMTNMARHSGAHKCVVRIGLDGDLFIEVIDDGIGIIDFGSEIFAESAGAGLRSMRQRATELGGELTVESTASGGTKVALRLPFPRES